MADIASLATKFDEYCGLNPSVSSNATDRDIASKDSDVCSLDTGTNHDFGILAVDELRGQRGLHILGLTHRLLPRMRASNEGECVWALRDAFACRNPEGASHALADCIRTLGIQAGLQVLQQAMDSSCNPLPVLIESCKDLAKTQRIVADQRVIVLQAAVYGRSSRNMWLSQSQIHALLHDAAPELSLPGFDAVCEVLQRPLEAIDMQQMTAVHLCEGEGACYVNAEFGGEERAALVGYLFESGNTRDAAAFMQRPCQADLLARISVQQLYYYFGNAHLSTLRAIVRTSKAAQMQLIEVLAANGNDKQALKELHAFGFSMSDARFASIRMNLKMATLGAWLRMQARDLVVYYAGTDSEAMLAVRNIIADRVNGKRTRPEIGDCFLSALDECVAFQQLLTPETTTEQLLEGEEKLAWLEVCADALFRKRGVVNDTAPSKAEFERSYHSHVVAPALANGTAACPSPAALNAVKSKREKEYTMPKTPSKVTFASHTTPFCPGTFFHDDDGYLRLPPSVPLVFVSTVSGVEDVVRVVDSLRVEGEHLVLGIDCEWTMPMLAGEKSACATLQLATRNFAWIFDLPSLDSDAVSNGTTERLDTSFCKIFTPRTTRSLVLLYGGTTDFSVIARSYPYLKTFGGVYTNAEGAVEGTGRSVSLSQTGVQPAGLWYLDLLGMSKQKDVSATSVFATEEMPTPVFASPGEFAQEADAIADAQPAKELSGGLAGLCHALLGAPLNKYWQMSSWLRRPLYRGQLEYGAMDAWVLPYLLSALLPLPLKSKQGFQTPLKKPALATIGTPGDTAVLQ